MTQLQSYQQWVSVSRRVAKKDLRHVGIVLKQFRKEDKNGVAVYNGKHGRGAFQRAVKDQRYWCEDCGEEICEGEYIMFSGWCVKCYEKLTRRRYHEQEAKESGEGNT